LGVVVGEGLWQEELEVPRLHPRVMLQETALVAGVFWETEGMRTRLFQLNGLLVAIHSLLVEQGVLL
jgi:hypothetical protein